MPLDSTIQHVASPGGEIVLQTERDFFAYRKWRYAPARRAGDYIYVSGVIVARSADQPATQDSFKIAMRQTFESLDQQLRAYGSKLAEIVLINTFHDWSAPEFHGDPRTQAEAFQSVKDEFIPEPHPAWTAVGISGFVRPEGILEIQIIAFSPAV